MLRLDKWLAEMTEGSRAEVKKWIRQGRVYVNETKVQRPETKLDPDRDQVTLDGEQIIYEQFCYYMLNKPAGVVSATTDREHKTVIDLLQEANTQDVFPVGRLDIDTEGLLLLTNDGALAQALMHPSHEVNKTYLVKVPGIVPQEKLDQLRLGVKLEDGPTAPAIVNLRDYDHERGFTLFDITIHEGRNRQIRRMCDAIGFPVRDLKRIKLGPLQLSNLGRGKFRSLSEQELSQLRKAAKL